MLGQHSLQPQRETYLESRELSVPLPALLTPRQNQLLAALSREDYERLLPHLELVTLPVGWNIYAAGDHQKYLYFIISGVVSKYCVTVNGTSSLCAIKGSEGVIGVSLFLGGDSSLCLTQVLSAGHAYRLGADLLKKEVEDGDSLLHLLLRYTQALVTQTSQIAVCNRHHSVEQQVCWWILSSLDRLPSNELVMTQEQIAVMLGVRRESVTEVAGTLQSAGLIHYRRGHITVLDRPRLEARVCECYAVVKREYDRLLHEF